MGSDVDTALASVRLACGVTGLPSAEVIRFNQGYRPNENPEIARLELVEGGAAREVVPEQARRHVKAGARVELRASWAACPRRPVCGDGLCTSGENQSACAQDCRDKPRGCTGAESYLTANLDARVVDERREGVSVTWLATSGRFAGDRPGGPRRTRMGWTRPTAGRPPTARGSCASGRSSATTVGASGGASTWSRSSPSQRRRPRTSPRRRGWSRPVLIMTSNGTITQNPLGTR